MGFSELSSKQAIIQILPRLSSQPSGVADYALKLASALRDVNVETFFLVGASEEKKRDGGNWNTTALPKLNAQFLDDAIQSVALRSQAAAIILHYSGYGYQRRGAPVWLLKGLRKWCSHNSKRIPLITVFHELYAMGRPWQSSYWLSPVQRLIARHILNLSQKAIATTETYRDRLLMWQNSADVSRVPVFSNVGEPGCGIAPDARPATAVTFGLASVEHLLFGVFRSQIEHIIATLEIERVVDIGPRRLTPPATLGGVPVIAKGAQPEHVVSELLQNARFGLLAYPFDVLAKSSVFAAYAAHGVVPIVFPERRGSFDDLEAGKHMFDGLQSGVSFEKAELALMQQQLFEWYQTHSLRSQASMLKGFIRKTARKKIAAVCDA